MIGKGIMAGTGTRTGQICTSSCTSLYPIEIVGDSPYSYPVNTGIPNQNGDEL